MYTRTVLFALCVAFALAENPLSFSEALDRRLEIDKRISAMERQSSAAELNIDLSSALGPTELETVFEDFGRDEIEIAATQVIEFPTTIKNRKLVAETELNGVKAEVDNLQIQIHHELSTYFLAASKLDQELTLSRERLGMSMRILEWQERQFKEGALPESELIRTRYEIAGLNAAVGRLELSQELLAEELGLYLNMDLPATLLDMAIPEFPEKTVITNAWSQLESAPAITRKEAQVSILKAIRKASESPFISSVAFSAGMKLLPELDEQFPIVGISIETPLFSKRSTTIQQSEYGLRAGIDELESIRAEISVAGRHWKNRWNMNVHELTNLQEILIPEARQLYTRIEDEYLAGAHQYLEVLNTQALLTDLQEKELEIQTEMATLLFEMNLTLGVTIYEFD